MEESTALIVTASTMGISDRERLDQRPLTQRQGDTPLIRSAEDTVSARRIQARGSA